MEPAPPTNTTLQETIDQARDQAREQLTAAWQLYVAKIEEQLRSGWDQQLGQIVEERFAEMRGQAQARMEQVAAERVAAREEALGSQWRERLAAAETVAEEKLRAKTSEIETARQEQVRAMQESYRQQVEAIENGHRAEIARVERAWQDRAEAEAARLAAQQRSRAVAEVEERLRAEMQAKIDTQIQPALAGRLEEMRERERRDASRRLSEQLNQAVRRLRQAGIREEWNSALIDAAAKFGQRAALFSLQGDYLHLEASSDGVSSPDIRLTEAAALQEAVRAKEPVVAARTVREISLMLAQAFETSKGDRVYAFPLVSGQKVAALLYVEGPANGVDMNALETLAAVAASVQEARLAMTAPAPATRVVAAPAAPVAEGLVAIQAAASPAAARIRTGPPGALSPGVTQAAAAVATALARPAARPSWSELPAEEQDLHLRAQRFARVQVAEMRLYKSQAVKQGRQDKNLYRALKEDIDRGREAFRRQFVGNYGSMVDYFHVELVRTLANDDAALLGTEYPGPLI
ncbi:MAG: hypothetical protein U0Q16_26010 [Bryobacteraceae bacterium]